VTGPFSIAFDGAGNVWVTSTTGRLGEFNSTGSISGSSGFSDGYTSAYVGLAIDGSGNVWVVRPGGIGGTTTGSLTEYVGAAVPVVTPIVANLRAPYGSQQQNLP
jgi:ligand-binding sensor domain-containing protein